VRVLVVADACTDSTAAIARAHGCSVICIESRNVGMARAAGADWLIRRGARWLCCTDADSRVPENWIEAQLACASDAVCGTVGVDDWHEHPEHVVLAFRRDYQDRDGHRHIHGANLGVSTSAYRRAGGFPDKVAHEDVGLVHALIGQQANIAWVRDPRVMTSARRLARAPEGFAAWLRARSDGTGLELAA
jgi:glycosyltransferase involved in cell wall biosynthesis